MPTKHITDTNISTYLNPLITKSILLNGGGNYSTIQAAINDSTSGDYIYVRKGNYTEALDITGHSGIHIHMEPGVVVTTPSDTRALYGTSITGFKLTGGGRFVNNGIQNAILIYCNETTPQLKFSEFVELNSGKQYVNYYFGGNNYYTSDDGINYSVLSTVIPFGLRTIGKDGTNRVFAVANDGATVGFYYSVDNGVTWTMNNTGIGNIGTIRRIGFYHSSSSTVFVSANNTIYKSGNYGTDSWTSVGTGLPTAAVEEVVNIGNYAYAICNYKVYRADITLATPSWEVFNSGMETATTTHLASNGTNRLYSFSWSVTERKILQCKVTETSTWSEVVFPISLLTNNVSLYSMLVFNNYLFVAFDKIGNWKIADADLTGAYPASQVWRQVIEGGSEASSLTEQTSLYKCNNFLYYYAYRNPSYYDGTKWIRIKGGTDVELEFDSAYSWGYSNSPNSTSAVMTVYYANLKLRCREIYSKRNVALDLLNLYGNLDAKVGRLETGVPGMPNGESGSTALLTRCNGYFEADEIIVNNVGHAISPRWGTMYFKVKKMHVTSNHPTYQVQVISQISGQALASTSSTIEFDEIINNKGKYVSGTGVWHDIGFLTLRGKRIVADSTAIYSTANLDAKVDIVENRADRTAFSGGCLFPYVQTVKNISFKSEVEPTVLLINDTITGGSVCATVLDNVNIFQGAVYGYGLLQSKQFITGGTTVQASTMYIKGTNTFNKAPNSLITFTGEGIVSVNGNILNNGRYFYLVGNETTDGSWRIYAVLSGEAIMEKRISGTWTQMSSWLS